MERERTERLLRDLYAARVRGDLHGLCATFAPGAYFRIAGASNASPIALCASGAEQYRPILALLIKTFTLRDQEILSMIVDGPAAAVHWRASVFSRITGTSISTELVDIVRIRDERIASYIEFFVPS